MYIVQHIAPLVWASKAVVRFAPLVRLTPLSPTRYLIDSYSVVSGLDWTGLGSVAREFELDWIFSTQFIAYSTVLTSRRLLRG